MTTFFLAIVLSVLCELQCNFDLLHDCMLFVMIPYVFAMLSDIASIVEMVIPFMSTKWFNMGLQLGVDINDLNRIQYDTQHCMTACRNMFAEWLKSTQTEKTWKKLVEALCSQSVGEFTLAKKITAQ